MSKSIYVQFLSEQSNLNSHYLNRLIKLLSHSIAIEPFKKQKDLSVTISFLSHGNLNGLKNRITY